MVAFSVRIFSISIFKVQGQCYVTMSGKAIIFSIPTHYNVEVTTLKFLGNKNLSAYKATFQIMLLLLLQMNIRC